VVVIGLSRGTGGLLHSVPNIGDTQLSAGDVLLVQGAQDRIERLRGRQDLMLLDASLVLPRSPLAPTALAIMATVLILAALKLLPIHVSAFLGVMAMLVTGCVRFDGIGRALSLEVVLLVASSVALGRSFVATGAAGWQPHDGCHPTSVGDDDGFVVEKADAMRLLKIVRFDLDAIRQLHCLAVR